MLEISLPFFNENKADMSSLGFSCDNRFIVAGPKTRSDVRVFDLHTKKLLHRFREKNIQKDNFDLTPQNSIMIFRQPVQSIFCLLFINFGISS